MPRISSSLIEITPELRSWLRDEYSAILAEHRRKLCGFTDHLEIRIPEILCETCCSAGVDGILTVYRGPDVLPESSESDLTNILDEDMAAAFIDDEDEPRCKSCRRNLHGEALYIETVELSERLGVTDETNAIEPSKKRRQQVFRFYGRKCFGCGSHGPLEIDHIHPRSQGGTAAFQNLQPLCRKCGQSKADTLPQHILAVRDPWPGPH